MEDALRHVEEAFRNGSDINFKKRDMEESHVGKIMLLEKLLVINKHVLLIVSGLIGLRMEDALRHVEEAFRNGPDINFKKRDMEDCHVVAIQ